MTQRTTKALLSIDAGPDADAEELEEITHQLRDELLELDLEEVDLVTVGKAPKGARAVDPVSLGQLIITLAASGGLLAQMIGTIKDWFSRHKFKSVKLQLGGDVLEVTDVSSEEQQRLIETFIKRHG